MPVAGEVSYGSADGGEPSREQVARQLERILADPLFAKSQRLGGFLRYSVETALAGAAHELKEYVIGVQVFERGETYSPQEDPIVRIMAGRLRAKLAEYYQDSGESDPILIELPRGGYASKWHWRRRPPAPLRGHPPQSPEQVGRQDEMSRLRAAFHSVSGGGLMAGVAADAGMGKTTFAEDFLAELQSAGLAHTARGRCSERLADTDAFAPVLEALDGLCRGEAAAPVLQLLKRSAPVWHAHVFHASDDSTARTSTQERMRREFAAFFEELSRTRPVVLFLDDLHWADASTCDLLSYLGARLRNIRILILTTYRPGAILAAKHPFLPLKLDLERRGLCREIPLSFLGKEDVERYIATRFPGHAFPAEFSAVIHERTEGNPLFFTDLLRYLAGSKVLVEQDGRWTLARSISEIRGVIPAGAHGMIGVTIGQLEEQNRNILLVGAVQGMLFDSAVAARVLGLDPVQVEERLRELETVHRFVRAIEEQDRPGLPLSVRYRFVHVFYQNALYASLTPSRRAAQSLAVAGVLAGLAGDASRAIAADLAVLFESGRDCASASRYFLHAARNAARVFAYPEAALLCERGLRSLATLPESRQRDQQEMLFSLTLGMALMSTRGYAAPEVERTYRRSRELCLKLNEIRRLVPVLWGIHTCETNGGRLPQALETALEMRRAAEALQHKDAIVEALHAYGTTLAFLGRLPEARQALERILEIAPVSQHEFRGSLYVLSPHVTSLSMLARLLTLMGHLDLAMQRAAESVELANRLAHPHSLCYATFWVGWILHARGDHEQACQYLEPAMIMGRTHGLPLIAEWGRVVRGSAFAHMGRHAEGIAEIRKSIERQDEMGSKLERAYCLTLLAEALLADGQAEEALRWCDQALEFTLQTEGRGFEPETHRVRAEAILAYLGDARREEVEGELREALRLARAAGSCLLEVRAAASYARFQTDSPQQASESASPG